MNIFYLLLISFSLLNNHYKNLYGNLNILLEFIKINKHIGYVNSSTLILAYSIFLLKIL